MAQGCLQAINIEDAHGPGNVLTIEVENESLTEVFSGFGERGVSAEKVAAKAAGQVLRKGATAAREGEAGIIPGSMGTPSYIVEGLGNQDSFMSCSHGAGRVMGRKEASRRLTPESCDLAMEGVVYDRWSKIRRGKDKGMFDLREAPQAYKEIDAVIQAELDLIRTVVKLRPLAVVKG